MAEGEHTIVGRIPLDRLHGIAAQKLWSFGVAARSEGTSLAGDLQFATPLANPLGGAPLLRARFEVEGHDRLRFVEPPLSALGPVPFQDLDRRAALDARLGDLLRRRAAALREVAARIRALRIEAALDPAHLRVRAVIRSGLQAFELVGGPEGVRVARVLPASGKPYEVPEGVAPVRLEDHATASDLELWLDSRAAAMQAAAAGSLPSAPAAIGAPRVQLTAPPRNALTLEHVVQAFGAEAIIAPNAPLELFQDLEYRGTRYRFVAKRDVGTTFHGRIIGPTGDAWSGSIDLARFGGTAALVAAALGAPGEAEHQADASMPAHLRPQPGEVWVMNVLIEQASGDEIRYVGTDIDGRPYGAARVLKKGAFEAVFSSERGGWRLLVEVEKVEGGTVQYRQLDAQRRPAGSSRRIPLPVLMANFVPEAAAY